VERISPHDRQSRKADRKLLRRRGTVARMLLKEMLRALDGDFPPNRHRFPARSWAGSPMASLGVCVDSGRPDGDGPVTSCIIRLEKDMFFNTGSGSQRI